MRVPWGLPRVVVTACYFIVLCFTGMAIQAADPLQQLMKMNGAYKHIENDNDRSAAIASVVGFGISFAVLSGIAVGPIFDLLGAKLTALTGLALHSFGYIFMFFTDVSLLYFVSGVCFGAGFQFILNSHLSAGCLFPKNLNMVLSIVSAGPDLSLFMPSAIYAFANHYGGDSAGVQLAVLQYLGVFVTIAALIDLFLLPLKPYGAEDNDDKNECSLEKVSLVAEDDDAEMVGRKSVGPLYATYDLMSQLKTPDYWLYAVMFTLTFCRKKHFSLFVRPILYELDPDPNHATANFYSALFNRIAPGGFIPAILWGACVDQFGIIPMLFVSNTLGVFFCGAAMIPWMPLQVFTIAIYIIYQSFVFGQCIAFIASVYGFTTIATLLGIASFISGMFSLLLDFYWPSFINNILQSYRLANLIWVALGIALYGVPIALLYFKKSRADKEDLFLEDEDDNLLETILPMTSVFDRNSLQLLGRRADKRRSGRGTSS